MRCYLYTKMALILLFQILCERIVYGIKQFGELVMTRLRFAVLFSRGNLYFEDGAGIQRIPSLLLMYF